MWREQSGNSVSRRKPDLMSTHGLGKGSVGEVPVLQTWGPAFRSPPRCQQPARGLQL
ncbi:rCG52026 [Rattus norvegicus]|uniref:RCG52026 n=1 Tax=Rattus norvegicus TaxID=10116 RepID=A6K3P2_RAT|nr:rCG52026 [Rattus norvegicus]